MQFIELITYAVTRRIFNKLEYSPNCAGQLKDGSTSICLIPKNPQCQPYGDPLEKIYIGKLLKVEYLHRYNLIYNSLKYTFGTRSIIN
jgi:hypothetical protein